MDCTPLMIRSKRRQKNGEDGKAGHDEGSAKSDPIRVSSHARGIAPMVLVGVVLMRDGQWSTWAVPHIGHDCLKTDASASVSFFYCQPVNTSSSAHLRCHRGGLSEAMRYAFETLPVCH